MTAERTIKADIALACGRGDVRLFNNPCGEGWVGRVVRKTSAALLLADYRHITYGLCPGSSDLIGWRSVVVTPEMLGCTLAVIAALEVKGPRGRLGDGQPEFLSAVQRAGGYAGVVRSVAEAERVLGR